MNFLATTITLSQLFGSIMTIKRKDNDSVTNDESLNALISRMSSTYKIFNIYLGHVATKISHGLRQYK